MAAGETVHLQFDKETASTIRYREVNERPRDRDLVRFIYIGKWFLGDDVPDWIRIVVFKD